MLRGLLILAFLAPALGNAATLRSVTVDRVDGIYVMRSEVWFDVSIDKIFGVLLDWDQSTKFSSRVTSNRTTRAGRVTTVATVPASGSSANPSNVTAGSRTSRCGTSRPRWTRCEATST